MERVLHALHRSIADSGFLTQLVLKLRNQCNAVVVAHLNDGIEATSNGEGWLIGLLAHKPRFFIDVGANTGAWSRYFISNMQYPCAGVLFEPSTIALEYLNSEHFVGGGTGLMVWVGAAVPTGEMRC